MIIVTGATGQLGSAGLENRLRLVPASRLGVSVQARPNRSATGPENRESHSSHIYALHFSPIQVPAWTVAKVRKQGVNAYLVSWLVEIEIGFAILLRDRVITLDSYHSEWIAGLRDPVPH
jgi:hypothetical protein